MKNDHNASLLTWALGYASKGYPVLPLHTPINGKCDCPKKKCSSIGKHPRVPHGFKDASTDPGQIKRWWEKWPDANIGIPTGEESNLLVIDIDNPNASLELQKKVGKLPETLTVKTGRGFHRLYRYPKGHSIGSATKTGLPPRIHLRANGGYIVAPPSLHEFGEKYKLSNPGLPILPTPEVLIPLFKKPDKSAIKAEGPIPKGTRNETLTSEAGRMWHEGDSFEEMMGKLLRINRYQCDPPMDDDEVEKIAVSISSYPREKAWPQLDDEALYGLAGDFVRLIEPHSEADPFALLIEFLTFYGNAIGRSAYFSVEAARHHCNLFTCLVGRTSKARKGTSLAQVKQVFQEVNEDVRSYIDKRVQAGLSSGEGLIWSVRDPIEVQKPVKRKSVPTGKYETVQTDPGIDDKRLLLIEEEFASPLQVMGRSGNTLSPVLRQAWDGNGLQTLTKNNTTKAIEVKPHISTIGHITKGELLRFLTETEYLNGFGNRFLWACVKRSKNLAFGGNLKPEDRGLVTHKLESALSFATRSNYEMTIGEIDWAEEAKPLWQEVYGKLSEGKPGLLGSMTSRAEAQVTRLAMIYALLDRSRHIEKVHLRAALAVWQYCEDSARFIFGKAMGDPAADKLLRALKDAGEPGMMRTEIRDLFSRNKKKEAIDRIVNGLAKKGLVSVEQEGNGQRVRLIEGENG